MEKKELRDIVIAAVVLAFVFSYSGLNLAALLEQFPVALLGVSTGFILHELGHRTLAKKFNVYAEFVMWKAGLGIALLLALVTSGGFTFAAPGAVVIHERRDLWGQAQRISKKQYGLISLAGPVMNLVLAGLFFGAGMFVAPVAMQFAAGVNIWLGLFNMIPIPPLDGSKILAWDRRIWVLFFAVFALLFFFV